MHTYLDFEKSVADLEGKIEELRHQAGDGQLDVVDEVSRLQARVTRLLGQTYGKLTPMQKVQVARHPERPQGADFIFALIEDFTPLAGDRVTGDDPALVGGLGRFRGASMVVLGHRRGHDAATREHCNGGLVGAAGLRKARRLMELAERFRLPLLTFIDSPGVDPSQSGMISAVAECLTTMLGLRVPVVAVVVGEGGGAAAMPLMAANRVMMLEHAIAWTVPPETSAALLWRDREKTPEAAEAQALTAQDMERQGLVDRILAEPLGGAHRDWERTARTVGGAIEEGLAVLAELEGSVLRARRREKMLAMGSVVED